ncbi:MAG: TonB-dependent receptor [Bacteroidaceae bacterium]|nr:TonB-dependent receptor [Bacteroidaceae bacterium]
MQKHILLAFLFILLAPVSWAQSVISGRATDATTGEDLPFVNVRLTRPGQTKVIQGTTTGNGGTFTLGSVAAGDYTLTLSYVGYNTLRQDVHVGKDRKPIDLGALAMTSASQKLGEATVSAEKSAMRLEVDRKSYNVAQDLSNVGATASEALENIPSVEVDQDGNISLRGSTSVEVWLNGKPSGLTSENRSAILEQMPAESIERIEVIDNPGSKYSAEGSAGIINIVLKNDRKAGYYGSLQVGANTEGGANASGNINYNSKWVDAYVNIGYRHRKDENGSYSRQDLLTDGVKTGYQNGDVQGRSHGNNLFTRAGITLHASKKDDITLGGSYMKGGNNSYSLSPYHYGTYSLVDGVLTPFDTSVLTRDTKSRFASNMYNVELDYRHSFSERHFIDFHVSNGRWKSDTDNFYRDSTTYTDPFLPTKKSYQSRPGHINNRWTSLKLDYENMLNERVTLQTGYNFDFHNEHTPQEAMVDPNDWYGNAALPDTAYYNDFYYKSQVHALYASATMKFGKFGIQAGLRGEYWHVNTRSLDFYQQYENAPQDKPYNKDFFQLFPTLFLSYQITEGDQLQLNYTRRLRRPHGGELNSFMDTREATSVRFGNPKLTPEYSNSFALNYLKTLEGHSFLVSLYYRPTTSVLQRISYHIDGDPRLFSTSMNLSRNTNAGIELTAKDKFWERLDLTTTLSGYYFGLAAFDEEVLDPLFGQTITVSGKKDSRFVWNARIKAAVTLPWDISLQCTGYYRSRQVITQGYRNPSYGIDLGLRKHFLNRQLTLAINCRDVLDSHKFISTTHSDTFEQYSKRWRHGRKVNFTLTWNFGNTKPKKRPEREENGGDDDDSDMMGGGYE